jgi:hypothetical protein
VNFPAGAFFFRFSRPSRQLSKSSVREKNQVQTNLDLHFAINISVNSPFGMILSNITPLFYIEVYLSSQ